MHRLPIFLLAVTGSALGGVTGHVSAQGQAIGLSSADAVGGTRQAASLMLEESIGLHYSGMPFGPNVALIGAGLEALNVNSWSTGAALSGRAASLDLSVALFPRRALPVRLYARGTITDASGPSALTLGNRNSLLYGASLNFDPDKKWPGIRVEAQEYRYSAPGSARTLGELARTISGSVYKSFGEHQVNLGAQFRQDERELLGKINNLLATGAWTSPRHQTSLVFGQTDRLLVPGLASAAGSATDRFARLAHGQRWTPSLATDASVRVIDSSFGSSGGTQLGLGLGATWKPLARQDLLVSGWGDFGTTRTRNPAGAAGATVGGGGFRAGYARPLKRVVAGLAIGGGVTRCGCLGGIDATRGNVDGTITLATLDFERVSANAEYTLSWVEAPPVLGGAHLEHHARLQGQARIKSALTLLTLGYDDGVRDYVDVITSRVVPFHERVFVGALSAQLPVGVGIVNGEVRHARGASFAPPSPFVTAPLASARWLTHVSLDGVYPVGPRVETRAGAMADWTSITGNQSLFTAGLQGSISVLVGRLVASLTYQYTRSNYSGLEADQHVVRLMLSRPFAL